LRQPLTARYRERLAGVLSYYDRIIVTGTLRQTPRDRFVADSPLEQSGFELWVPPACDTPGSQKVRC